MPNLIRPFLSCRFYALGFRRLSSKSQSIFELIAGQMARDTNWQIDESLFPKILVRHCHPKGTGPTCG